MKLACAVLHLAFLVAQACRPAEPSDPRPTPEEVAGHYAAGVAGIVSFDLTAEGRYESLVLSGMSIDGCGTFEGAGVSKGTWAFVGGSIRFTPDRADENLVVRFAEVRATPVPDGLRVAVGEREATLPRLETQD